MIVGIAHQKQQHSASANTGGVRITDMNIVRTDGVSIVPGMKERGKGTGRHQVSQNVSRTTTDCTIPSQSAIGQWDWGFHTVRGVFDPRDHCFRPRVVGVVEVWKDFQSGDGNLSSRGALALYDPQPISDRPVGLGFPHRAGRFRPGGRHRFRLQVVGDVDVWWDC